jgi:hypothetical protein
MPAGTYSITDFSKSKVDYARPDGTLNISSMRTAFIGAWTGSPVVHPGTGGATISKPQQVKMAHLWATAVDGATPPKTYRKHFPLNANVAVPAVGTVSAKAVDGLTWSAMGYVGERDRGVV